MSLRGVIPALVTPFTPDGERVDFDAFGRLLESQLRAGVSGLVPCGTTGEAPTLSDAEQREVVAHTVRAARGKVPVVAGTGSNSTKKSIEASLAALEAGADAVMIVMPYYNKPSQLGLVRHVELIAKAVAAPIVLYNIPGRSAVELGVEATLKILDSCENVVAVKDATGGVLYCQELLCRAGDRVSVLSGDDVLTLPMMSVGAVGVVSVTSNLLPAPIVSMVGAALSGDFARARAINRDLYPIHRALFSEPNPQPVKAALAKRRLMSAAVRPPLVEASPACVKELEKVLLAYEGRAAQKAE